MQNQLWRADDLFHMSHEERWVWIGLLGVAGEKNAQEFELDVVWFCHHATVSRQAFESAMEKLASNGCVTATLRQRHADDCTDRQTDRQTDEEAQKKIQRPPPPTGVGPIAQLSDLNCGDFLIDLPHRGQEVWIERYGLAFVRQHMPDAWVAWEAKPERHIMGQKQVFIKNFFDNEAKGRTFAHSAGTPAKVAPLGNVYDAEAERTRRALAEIDEIRPPTSEERARVRAMAKSVVKNFEPQDG